MERYRKVNQGTHCQEIIGGLNLDCKACHCFFDKLCICEDDKGKELHIKNGKIYKEVINKKPTSN